MQLSQSVLIIFFVAFMAKAQTFQPLPLPLNMPLGAEANPCLTGNGRTLVYDAAIGENERTMVAISYQRGGVWTRPEAIPGITTKAEKIFHGAHFITFEGNFVFFASGRHGGVGGNDIWFVEKAGNGWSQPTNLGKPINSAAVEMDPALSPDGRWLYFVRYTDKKTSTGKPCGKIFVAERRGKGSYLEPKEVPGPVNKGCECNPRILADNSTMTFASERPGGKGGYDQYRTHLQNDGKWSPPVALDFINTKEDDLYISIPAGGNYVYLTGKSKVATDLVRARIPVEHHPTDILFLSGKVKDANVMYATNDNYLNAKIGVFKTKENKMNYIGTEEGHFALFLPVKENYNITFSSKGYSFHTLQFNLDTLKRFKELSQDVELVPLKTNNVFNIGYKDMVDPNGKLYPESELILKNTISLLQDNPSISIELGSHKDSIIIDSIVNPLLTEFKIDTSVVNAGTSIHYDTLYHNDNTLKEAKALADYLIQKGISPARISAKGYGNSKPCNLNMQNGVKCQSRRIEIRITKEE